MKVSKTIPLFAALLCALGINAAAAGGNDNFYYHQDGSGVYVELSGTLDVGSESGSDILLAFYDGNKLIKTELFKTGSAAADFSMSEVYVALPYEPAELSMRSFIWSGGGSCTPLSDAANISDIPANAELYSGSVVNTYKTLGSLDESKVMLQYEYNGELISVDADTCYTDAADHLFEPADFYMIEDEFGYYKLLSFEPKTDGVLTMSLSELDIQSVELSDDAGLYINGSYSFLNADEIEETILSAKSSNTSDSAKAKLIDSNADGRYEYVLIDCYYYAVVDTVHKSKDTNTIYFSFCSAEINGSRLAYSSQDNEVTVSFEDRNGNELSIDDIQEGDKLYIKSDYIQSFSTSFYYNIIIDDDRKSEPKPPENKLNYVYSDVYAAYTDNEYRLDGSIGIYADGENRSFYAEIILKSGEEAVYTDSFAISSAIKSLNIDSSLAGISKTPDSGTITITDTDGNIVLSDDIPVTAGNISTVYGRITGTSKTDEALLPSEVNVSIEENRESRTQKVSCALNDFDMFMYSRMTLSEKNGEYTLITMTPLRTDNKVTFPASQVSEDKNYSDCMITDGTIPVYTSEESNEVTAYRLAAYYQNDKDVRLFINGSEIPATDDNMYMYIFDNPCGSVTLIDETETGGTACDGYYEYIFIDCYEDYVVDSVGADGIYVKANYTTELLPMSDGADIRVFLDGKETDISELRAGDVLSIANDANVNFDQSEFYDIYISRDTVTGTVTSINFNNNTVNIDGEKYEYTNYFNFELTSTYKLYLNKSGYVVYAEQYAYNDNFAAVVSMYSSAVNDYATVRLIDKSGAIQSYECRDSSEEDNFFTVFNGKDPDEDMLIYDGGSYTKADIEAIENNVCTYTITGSGIRFKNKLTAIGGELAYNASTSSFGETAVDPEHTSIAVVTDYLQSSSEPFGITADALTDGAVYEVFMYIPDGTVGVPFVIITNDSDLNAPEYPEYTEFGLITAMYSSAGKDYATISFAAPDGSIKEYECYDNSVEDEFYSLITGNIHDGYYGNSITMTDMAAPSAAVYTVKRERISFKESVGAVSEGVYSADESSIGDIPLTDETKLVYIYNSDSSTAITRDMLIDGESYTVYDAAYNGTEAVYIISGEITDISYETILDTGVVVGMYQSVYKEYPTVRIVDRSGEVKTYTCRSNSDANYFFTVFNGKNPHTERLQYDGGGYTKNDIENITKNVCIYRIYHTGEVSFKEYLSAEGGEVRYTGTAFGDYAIDPETTAIIDIDSYMNSSSSAMLVNTDMLYLNGLYSVYVYDCADDIYRFALITSSVTGLSPYTPVSIVKSENGATSINDYGYFDYTVITGNTEQHIYLDSYDLLHEGDAVIYTADENGIAYNLLLVNSSEPFYDDMFERAVSNNIFSSIINRDYLPEPETNTPVISSEYDAVKIYFGPIYEKNSSSLTLFLRQSDGASSVFNDTIEFMLDHDVNSYVYDYSLRANTGSRVYQGNISNITSNIYNGTYISGGDNGILSWSEAYYSEPPFALVKTLNGEVTDVVYYIN